MLNAITIGRKKAKTVARPTVQQQYICQRMLQKQHHYVNMAGRHSSKQQKRQEQKIYLQKKKTNKGAAVQKYVLFNFIIAAGYYCSFFFVFNFWKLQHAKTTNNFYAAFYCQCSAASSILPVFNAVAAAAFCLKASCIMVPAVQLSNENMAS